MDKKDPKSPLIGSPKPSVVLSHISNAPSLVGSANSPVISGEYLPLSSDKNESNENNAINNSNSSLIESNKSNSSFEWLNDEEELIVEGEEPSIIDQTSQFYKPEESPEIIPSWLTNGIYFGLLASNFIALLLSFFGLSPFDGKIEGVSLKKWFFVSLSFLLLNHILDILLKYLVRYIRRSQIFCMNEFPVFLEASRGSLRGIIVILISASIWYSVMPYQKLTHASNLRTFIPKTMICFFVYFNLKLLQSIFLQRFRSKFLQRTFKMRIIESRFKCYIVDQLKEAADLIYQRNTPRINSHFSTQADISAKNNRESQSLLMANPPSSPIPKARDYNVFKKNLIQKFNSVGYESASTTPPKTDIEAKLLAKDIFTFLCPHDRDYLSIEDFRNIFKTESATKDSYYIFDRDYDGRVTKREFRITVVSIFKDQRNLNASVLNSSVALNKLDTLANLVVILMSLFISLTIFEIQVQSLLTLMLSFVIGVSFVIGEAAKNAFGGLLFMFNDHPYDVGDRIFLSSFSNIEDLMVLQVNIMTTIFRRWNGQEVSISNGNLSNTTIINLSRTQEQWERIDFEILITNSEQLLTTNHNVDPMIKFREQLDLFLKCYSNDYFSVFELRAIVAADFGRNECTLDTICFMLKIQCKPTIESHRKIIRHSRLIAFVKKTINDLGLKFAHEIIP